MSEAPTRARRHLKPRTGQRAADSEELRETNYFDRVRTVQNASRLVLGGCAAALDAGDVELYGQRLRKVVGWHAVWQLAAAERAGDRQLAIAAARAWQSLYGKVAS